MLRAQRKHDAVVIGGCLQFEIEAAAESLAERQPPGAVDPPPERRVDDHLLAAARKAAGTTEASATGLVIGRSWDSFPREQP